MKVIIVLIIITLGIQHGEGLTCLQCDRVPTPTDCRTVARCTKGEYCAVERLMTNDGRRFYNLGCKLNNSCADSLRPGTGGKLTHSGCPNCCDTDLCNSKGCGDLGYPGSRGPVCYSCDHTQNCTHVTTCAAGEVCFVRGTYALSPITFTSGCKSNTTCGGQGTLSGAPPIIGRRRSDPSPDPRPDPGAGGAHVHVACETCCAGDLCNADCDANHKQDACTPNPCVVGACSVTNDGYTCACYPGYIGRNCSQSDPCTSKPCVHGVCTVYQGSYLCACHPGYKGQNCTHTDHCTSSPCVHGTCTAAADSYSCTCTSGYIGAVCSQTDPCAPRPCLHGICTVFNGKHLCACHPGYTGHNCTETDHCYPSPCVHGRCSTMKDNYTCSCSPGYTGRHCTQIDPCQSNPCVHGVCTNYHHDYLCACHPGYSGHNCTKTDYCANSPCVHGACVSGVSGYTCSCSPGYVGLNCSQTDHCVTHSCVHGTCVSGLSNYTCSCSPGYTGDDCSRKDYCFSRPCVHGSCVNGLSYFTCNCLPGYINERCSQPAHECKDYLALNRFNYSVPSGVYTVLVKLKGQLVTKDVYCDMDADGSGWTVFQKRFNGTVNFTRTFAEYENGFGDIHAEHWLGLKWIYSIVSTGLFQLRIDLSGDYYTRGFALYQPFSLGPPDGYTLNITRHGGTLGPGFAYSNGRKFTTIDHDPHGTDCGNLMKGGWWYLGCGNARLNDPYYPPGSRVHSGSIIWFEFQGTRTLRATSMKFKSV